MCLKLRNLCLIVRYNGGGMMMIKGPCGSKKGDEEEGQEREEDER